MEWIRENWVLITATVGASISWLYPRVLGIATSKIKKEDRDKDYVIEFLQSQVEELKTENKALKEENRLLREEMMKLRDRVLKLENLK